ncbi:hypothetical protein I3760_07G154900 [Carya illinoinensis]|uniref:uncharacterized protein LOC122317214 isoform X2 n=1 Tax=Carya illinoinensis TaxID=32201 RepID=UPI001BF76055|nr:uncharacterized protein LOC122317214 isoform X2 [Carya illinoinensis]KAG2698531.1 hypothetical protein I3760_07G154900 [Carya illinoinensis]
MDICHVPGRFPVSTLRFGHVQQNPGLPRYQTSPYWPYVAAAGGLRSETDPSGPTYRNRMFFLGMGFVAQFFAQELKKQGWVVSGTCTSLLKKNELGEMGFDMYLFDANEPEPSTLEIMKYHTHVIVSIPPVVGIGDPALQHRELLRSSLMDGNLQWLCYLSSTSVYGDRGGAWVDEDYPTSPASELANLRLVAEKRWLSLGDDLELSTQIFRLGGIYGPGRRRVYNIVDDDPAPREEVFAYASDLIEKKWPGRIKQSASRSESLIGKGGRRGEKRVSNARMKKELGVRLLHPSYRSGLQSIINHMEEAL